MVRSPCSRSHQVGFGESGVSSAFLLLFMLLVLQELEPEAI